jgi:predicted nucleic acid-binding protein
MAGGRQSLMSSPILLDNTVLSNAVAYTRKLSLVTDDRDARQIAVQYGIAKTGTIVETVHRNVLTLSQANEILHHMIILGYRCPLDKLDTLL